MNRVLATFETEYGTLALHQIDVLDRDNTPTRQIFAIQYPSLDLHRPGDKFYKTITAFEADFRLHDGEKFGIFQPADLGEFKVVIPQFRRESRLRKFLRRLFNR